VTRGECVPVLPMMNASTVVLDSVLISGTRNVLN
jgi:hypothetical protein